MNKEKTIAFISALILLILVLIFCLFDMAELVKNKDKEITKQKDNIELMQKQQETYTVNDSIKVSTIEALRLDKEQYKKMTQDQQKTIEQLRHGKKSEINYYTEIEKRDTFTITKLDTIYRLRDTCLVYEDSHLGLYQCRDSTAVEIRETIHQTIETEYKHKFLWWKWKVDGFRQNLWTDNPYSTITYSKFIKIE